jgi:hypothetical protein
MLFPLAGLVALGLGVATTPGIVSREDRTLSAEKGRLKLDGKTEAALDTLQAELQRRFHDRKDIDFGFGRVVRMNFRTHYLPPLMERLKPGNTREMRHAKRTASPPASGYEVRHPEVGWIDPQKLLPQMIAETDREAEAIGTLMKSKAEVAIYTFGHLGHETPSVRAKGPGYIRQKTSRGPDAEDLAKAAQRAWSTNESEAVVEGPAGWQLRCYRVVADHESCVPCHVQAEVPPRFPLRAADKTVEKARGKVGTPIGLLVIAVRPRRGTL